MSETNSFFPSSGIAGALVIVPIFIVAIVAVVAIKFHDLCSKTTNLTRHHYHCINWRRSAVLGTFLLHKYHTPQRRQADIEHDALASASIYNIAPPKKAWHPHRSLRMDWTFLPLESGNCRVHDPYELSRGQSIQKGNQCFTATRSLKRQPISRASI